MSEYEAALFFFYSPTCVPCKQVFPILDELEEEFWGRVLVSRINVAEEIDLANKYDVHSVPTIIFMRYGKVVGGMAGLPDKEQIKSFLEGVLENE
jgi:thioredoxin 1